MTKDLIALIYFLCHTYIMKKTEQVPRTTETSYHHARKASYYLGCAGVTGVFEPLTTNAVSATAGAIAIGVGSIGGIRHGLKYISARRRERNEPAYPQFQYSSSGFSDRYVAEVEYLAHRLAKALNERGVAQLSILDIDPGSNSPIVTELTKEMFETRLSEGYELSTNQMYTGLYGAAQSLDIL
jgi:hypothetical protein